ncbi:DUF6869 domain-containing protein [Stenotrophomonas sp.]|uniref:DUF6869 domain-containing protein n=1 Tax=Stenotrophomonas sp. TaxID=69392 RepID=UPI0028A921D9|nr:hypothetical protein [Stenotrophomonas sp.]
MVEEMKSKELVDSWVNLQKADHGSAAYKRDEWAAVKLNMMCVSSPSEAWEIVTDIFESTADEWIYENLGAGPLETLLGLHGEFAISALSSYAASNPKFLDVAAFVWPHSLSSDVAKRFLAIAGQKKR